MERNNLEYSSDLGKRPTKDRRRRLGELPGELKKELDNLTPEEKKALKRDAKLTVALIMIN